MNYILYLIYFILILGPIYLIWAISNINRRIKKTEWLNSQEYTILRIDVPKNNDKAPLAAEQMFAAIHGIFSESARYQNHISFEIVSKDKFIQFYVYIPVHLKDFVEGQIYAQYPTVEINEVDDYASELDIKSKNFASCELKLNKPDVYPIKQFTDFEVDPISGITSVMSKLNEGEELWFQMIIRPIGDEWQEKGHSMVSAVRNGKKVGSKSLGSKFLKGLFNFIKAILIQAVKPGDELGGKTQEIKLPASVEEALKSIEQKITKLGFETKIRLMSLASDTTTARLKCQNVAAAFKQFNTTNLNGFRVRDITVNDRNQWKDFIVRSFEDEGEIFNIAELASIYHLPHASVATPNIVWSGSKKGEPPANLPLKDNMPDTDLTIIGETNFRNVFRVFGIKRDDRRRHIYIVGKSGTGKSTLIENMAINDVCEGRGVIVVDPHGELADKVLSCIPDNRVNDVIVFDPSDREYPVAFNLLEHVDDDFKSIVASGFVGIFKKIFGDSWGPRLEHILRNTVLALLDFPDSTMLDIPRMLTNNRFREKVVEKVKDPIIKEFWLNEFASFDSKFRTEAVSPILNKVGQFLSSSTIRNIVGQSQSTINIREIMDQQKIMVVNLSRGKIGEDNSALLGAMMVTKVQLAAMSRADTTVDNRPDCYMYVDEFQNFATDSFAVILSEARKYNLALTMAHQYISQLPDSVREAVFGNAGTLISYRVGGADAVSLVKEYAPVFDENDLVNLDKFHIYIKLLIDGISSPAFSARTLPPVQKLSGNIDAVIKNSHERYSNTRTFVQDSIYQRSKEEEAELKAEAEAFKQGGLEALLVKKNIPVNKDQPLPNKEKEPEEDYKTTPVQWINPDDDTKEKHKKEEQENALQNQVKSEEAVIDKPVVSNADGEAGETEEANRSNEPKVIKYENILNGRLYKERTARGGVKWYLGEEIDEEKLMKSHTIIDEKGKKLIELSAKVADDKSLTHDKKPKSEVVQNDPIINTENQVDAKQPQFPVVSKPINEAESTSILPEIKPETALENLPQNLPAVLPAAAPADISKKVADQDREDEPTEVKISTVSKDDPTHLEEGKAFKIPE